ncbi:MAG: hypothetical protein CK426_00125 [Legionella sp.]|nr:MAG: hypothetical protein CK423_07955 [Legionella sp.]PJE00267.1 MAG: hypothetical protein CK426_00125 [Legionella sp.]
MNNTWFYKFGEIVYSLRWVIFLFWLCLLLVCIPLLPKILTPFKTTGFIAEQSPSALAEQQLNESLHYDHRNQLLVIYFSKTLTANRRAFNEKITESLSHLADFSLPYEVLLPKDNPQQISKDKHSAYAVIVVKTNDPLHGVKLAELRQLIKTPKDMSIQIGGEPVFIEDVNQQTQLDLYKADMVATPIAILTLLFVFGSFTAALLPILLGGGCALIILSLLYLIGHYATLSIFTINIALLLGLCLGLDYALFVISRFRDELAKKTSVKKAIARTQATAGKAIFFSGLAVFVSLSALFFFPINILFSVAVGGMIAVFVAVLSALFFLPAVLSLLNKRINFLSISFPPVFKSLNLWRKVAEKVIQRPVSIFISVFIFLLFLGYPFLSVQLGLSDYKIFPEHAKSRAFYDQYEKQFNGLALNPILLLVKTDPLPLLSKTSLYTLYDTVATLKKNPLIKQVNSIVDSSSSMTPYQYYQLYKMTQEKMPEQVKALLAITSSKKATVVTLVSASLPQSKPTKALIQQLRDTPPPDGLHFFLTGAPVINADIFQTIWHYLPYALLWIMCSTYLILLLLLRSLILPLKAILMNLLSLCACYGALVFIFQEGHLAHWLNFQPQGMLDISILVIIFCALFGFSMDYEVFLLSRIKEYHDKTHSNTRSVMYGIEKTSKIITSAALIVIFLCGSFMIADVLMVKAFGLGIAVAIFVDAFLIRTLLVPSTMVLLARWNWYLPAWLERALPKI